MALLVFSVLFTTFVKAVNELGSRSILLAVVTVGIGEAWRIFIIPVAVVGGGVGHGLNVLVVMDPRHKHPNLVDNPTERIDALNVIQKRGEICP
ncbi:hypothetical protein ARMGADRAFT_510594 [Armillaria gallica]|uniref:Uncharacterized protein n=1 Tax=Armillaria gallica TaxID=47427 RepID=A0A2H3DWI1_ARMGA|nr:hypothetical protein ARMGADRAFT_510594 [Armillaria gallica]